MISVDSQIACQENIDTDIQNCLSLLGRLFYSCSPEFITAHQPAKVAKDMALSALILSSLREPWEESKSGRLSSLSSVSERQKVFKVDPDL